MIITGITRKSTNNTDKKMPLAGDAKLNELTRRIIGAAISVSRTLGHGFLEQVYRNALMQQLTTSGLPVVTEQSFQVAFHGKPVGRYMPIWLSRSRSWSN